MTMAAIDAGANVIIATAAVISCIVSVSGLGWWMSGRFRKVERIQQNSLDQHEEKDQERHEENLERFRLISVALAKRGLDIPGYRRDIL